MRNSLVPSCGRWPATFFRLLTRAVQCCQLLAPSRGRQRAGAGLCNLVLQPKYRLVAAGLALVSGALVSGLFAAIEFRLALPGYRYQFPRDHFNHPDFATEWWYYTGSLTSSSGRPFGFELTFFRQAARDKIAFADSQNMAAVWQPDPIYLAHFAVSDPGGQSFFHTERMNRAGPGLAGISDSPGRYWNGNWEVRWVDAATGEQALRAVTETAALELRLKPAKPPVIHGQNGISLKGDREGQASHYISFTRLVAKGTLTWKGRSFSVDGLAWMDHEFFSSRLDDTLIGWDWFCVQLSNQEEFMFYRLRRKDGSGAAVSSGTFVDSSGMSHYLGNAAFTIEPGRRWRSTHTGGTYPISWTIRVPSLGLVLEEDTQLADQELASAGGVIPSYWEGMVRYRGFRVGKPVTGSGYLEMTGYDRPVGRFGL
jgi:predicted secreted hydrolase